MPDLSPAERALAEAVYRAFVGGIGGDVFDRPNLAAKALEYASTRTGKLITDIDSATMHMSRAMVDKAIEEGWDVSRLQTELSDAGSGPFGRNRALTIATTETTMAYNAGAASRYADDGVRYVRILDGPDDDECAHADGAIWTVEDFAAHPIAHPNCQRDAVPMDPDFEPGEVGRPHPAELNRAADVASRPKVPGITFPSASTLAGGPPTPWEYGER